MTTDAEDALEDLFEGRGEPGLAGFRVHRVERITRYKARSIRTVAGEDVVEIVEGSNQPPTLEWMSDEEIAVGGLAQGAIRLPRCTPNAALDAWLRGDELAAGDERYLRVTGPRCPKGDLYRIKSWRAEKPLRRTIIAEPVEQGSP